MDIKAIDKEYVANTYARFPVQIVSGKGSLVWDETGKEYIDMGSGIGVTAFGIGDETWKAAVVEQLDKVQHMSNLYYTEPCALLQISQYQQKHLILQMIVILLQLMMYQKVQPQVQLHQK